MTSPAHKRIYMVGVYSLAHFIVDFACAFLVFRSILGTRDGLVGVLLYNFFAFAFRLPLGVLADKCNRNYLFAAIGCALIAMAFAFLYVPVVAAVIAGVGSSMYHVGGGNDILNISKRSCSYLGAFLPPGAFGIFFGGMLGGLTFFPKLPIVIVLIAASLATFFMPKVQGKNYAQSADFSLRPEKSRGIIFVVTGLFLAAGLRSYVNLTMGFPWEGTGSWAVFLVCATALGKVIGAVVSDKLGVEKVAIFSLCVSALLFVFSGTALPGLLAVVLFNFTMPITIWLLAKVFPGAEGFSFGLFSFATFLGLLFVYFGVTLPHYTDLVLALITILLLPLLLPATRRAI